MSLRLLTILISFLYSGDSVVVKQTVVAKTYKGLTGEACKEMNDGGCMIYTYRLLEFKEDSVVISRQTLASCTPREREKNYNRLTDTSPETYHWTMVNDQILIEGFDEYGQLKLEGEALIGMDTRSQRVIAFKPVENK